MGTEVRCGSKRSEEKIWKPGTAMKESCQRSVGRIPSLNWGLICKYFEQGRILQGSGNMAHMLIQYFCGSKRATQRYRRLPYPWTEKIGHKMIRFENGEGKAIRLALLQRELVTNTYDRPDGAKMRYNLKKTGNNMIYLRTCTSSSDAQPSDKKFGRSRSRAECIWPARQLPT